jgi:predicted alpha/beta-fold hydrolase
VVLVHGLEGSADARYVRGNAARLFQAGMSVVRMNVRGCGAGDRHCSTLYHTGLSADLRKVAHELIAGRGLSRVGLLGYSMGGNMVLKALGEWAEDVPKEITSAAVVSPAMDLSVTSAALHQLENRVYEAAFLAGLIFRAVRKRAVRMHKLWGVRSVRDFDNVVIGPAFGFANAEDYYARSSSSALLERIHVPTLVLHAMDDPFIRMTLETRGKLVKSNTLHYVETAHGGHCGFLAHPRPHKDTYWAEQECAAFLARHFNARRAATWQAVDGAGTKP